MGVQGLWSLLDSTSQPVPIHTLRGKVLAIDVSIWLHQALKGYRDKDGNPLPNAHLIGMFHRICKFLNYGIKPVFVFDGGVPALKRQTMQNRRQRKLEAKDKSEVTRTKLLTNLVRQQLHKQMKKVLPPTQQMEKVISSLTPLALAAKRSTSPKKRQWVANTSSATDSDNEDEFAKLRKKLEGNESLNTAYVASLFSSESGKRSSASASTDSSDSDSEEDYRSGRNYSAHFDSITSPNFDSLPLETQHEILFEMQESRKSNSWGMMHEMPKDLQNFSSFQMDRLVKRRFLQKKIQTVQKEMGERHIHVQELDDLAMTNLEAEFASSSTKVKEIIGSKERGAVLIKTKTEGNSNNIPGTSKPGNREPEVITIDDYVEEWDSDDDISPTDPGSSSTFPAVSAQAQNNISEEDADLQKAIALSLAHEDFPEPQAQPEMINSSPERKIPEKLTSPMKTTAAAATQKSEVQKTQQSFVLPPEFQKGNNSVYKFLGWVGFNENVEANTQSVSTVPTPKSPVKLSPVISAAKMKQHESTEHSILTSESDNSDFEEVPETEEIPEKKIVPFPTKLPKPVFIPENGAEVKIGLPAVSIKLDQNFEFKKEDDIFADIFEESKADTQETLGGETEIISSRPGPSKSNAAVEVAPAEKTEMDMIGTMDMNADDNDSDFEDVMEEIELLEKQALNNSINGTSELKTEEESQKLTRTLGTLPSQSNPPPDSDIRFISAQYMQQQEKLNNAQKDLLSSRGNQDRIAASITDQMHLEAQELLSLFGIPFVVSPMEAESQCAFLDTACLTDGTITDDSDVWLFGGQRVYKNFFSQGEKPVQFFQYADLVRQLNLDREKLILVAILTGSDYTTGVDGVGPVLALEILTEFIGETTCAFDSLVKFREWWDSAQEEGNDNEEAPNKFKAKFRKLKLRPGFPSKAVYDAYMEPTLDASTEPFRWGSPDLISIKEYARKKFGWDDNRCESILGPVMRNAIRIESHGGGSGGRQTTMDSFVNIVGPKSKGKIKSKRLASAMKKLRRAIPNEINLSSDSDSDDSDEQSSTRDSGKKKRNSTPVKSNPKKKIKSDDSDVTVAAAGSSKSKATKTPRIPKKVDANIPQRVQAESKNKLLKEKAAKLMKKK